MSRKHWWITVNTAILAVIVIVTLVVRRHYIDKRDKAFSELVEGYLTDLARRLDEVIPDDPDGRMRAPMGGTRELDVWLNDQALSGDIRLTEPLGSGNELLHWNREKGCVEARDPWNHPLIYRRPSSDPTKRYDLYSAGPNGRDDQGGDDDVLPLRSR